MSYNYNKLRGKIIEIYGSQQNFADAMGWSQRTLSLKMNNKRFWKQPEIMRASNLLGINQDEIKEYFFDINVQCI